MKTHLFNLLLLLTVAGCLCITLRRPEQADPLPALMQGAFITVSPTVTPHPLDSYRNERQAQLQALQSALPSLPQTPDDALYFALQKQLLALQKKADTEARVEGALRAMGIEKCTCILQEDSLLLFATPFPPQAQLPSVLQLAADLAGLSPENVHLMAP